MKKGVSTQGEKRLTESDDKMGKKAPKNKTIDFTLDSEEGRKFVREICKVSRKITRVSDVLDRVICGDSLRVMEHMPQAFVDLLIVDPPYNLTKDYHGNAFQKEGREAYRTYTGEWLEKAIPLLKPTASIYVCCDWESSLVIGEVLYEHLKVRNRITWQREKGRGAKSNWKNGMEDIWYATVGNQYTFHLDAVMMRRKVHAPYKVEGVPKDWEETAEGNYRNTCPSNFWDDISIPYWSMPENTAHPTQKPEKLIAKLLLASSSEGDVVFDPFAGSGTTAVTAKKLGRRFVVVEQNELYCAWAMKRLEMAGKDPSIQGYRGGVFWERNSWAEQLKEAGKQKQAEP